MRARVLRISVDTSCRDRVSEAEAAKSEAAAIARWEETNSKAKKERRSIDLLEERSRSKSERRHSMHKRKSLQELDPRARAAGVAVGYVWLGYS